MHPTKISGWRQHRDEVARTEPIGWTGKTTREIAAQRWPEKQRGCTTVGVCAKGIKKELNTLDKADFVRDVENRDYHYLSHFEIAGDKGISRHLSASQLGDR